MMGLGKTVRGRCDVMVRAGTYRAPGQCEKRLGLKRIKIGDMVRRVCAHHIAMLERGVKAQVVP